MLRQEDERAIEDLFERLRNVERNSAARDADAEQLIRQRLAENPTAAYFMAQTIIVQEAALREAQQKIEQLESKQSQGGFPGGIFGGDRPAQAQTSQGGPWGRSDDPRDDLRRSRGNGGFLAGAAQTALGVTGGLLLGSMLTGLFTGDAQAGEAPPPEDAPEDQGYDDGGDMGDDFDVGGDF
ncbi:DUF2076 family protein [Devosia sp. Leaf64]|uniref:DUF2076 domain-containing protein n=1 Tax=Devosia sp. Leaf64 TaxID=1736229 RepID=UPI0009EA2DE9|nr:DUF2076 family protein [Devosia sp. Leaf64]